MVETTLLDAAFRLVSHSIVVQEGRNRSQLDDARLAGLRKEFLGAESPILQDALDRAKRLEETACEMADLARGPRNDHSGPPLTECNLAQKCPGFSSECYFWAINDGFVLTR